LPKWQKNKRRILKQNQQHFEERTIEKTKENINYSSELLYSTFFGFDHEHFPTYFNLLLDVIL